MVEARHRERLDQEALFVIHLWHRYKSDGKHHIHSVQGWEAGQLSLQSRRCTIEHVRVVQRHTCEKEGLTFRLLKYKSWNGFVEPQGFSLRSQPQYPVAHCNASSNILDSLFFIFKAVCLAFFNILLHYSLSKTKEILALDSQQNCCMLAYSAFKLV